MPPASGVPSGAPASAAAAAPRGGRAFGLAGRAALTRLSGDGTAALLGASDVAVVVDAAGVVVDAAAGVGPGRSAQGADYGALLDGWVGRRWVETVTGESRGKIEALLREAVPGAVTPRRQVNHTAPDGHDVPVAYAAVRLADGGLVAVGRDLRAVAALQQRLVETQQALERDYWRLRHVETRYRLVFERSREALVVVDASTRRIVDANAAAAALFGVTPERLAGAAFPPPTAGAAQQALEDLLVSTRLDARGDEVAVALDGGRPVRATATCFRQEAQTFVLVRLAGAGDAAGDSANDGSAGDGRGKPGPSLESLLEGAPDAFVVTDADGNVVTANRAFLDLAELADLQQAEGRPLGDYLGRPGANVPSFLGMLREHGVVRLAGTAIRGAHGGATEVEVSAVRAPEDDAHAGAVAWTIRDVGRRVGAGTGGARDLSRAVEELTGLVGRVSLPNLVRDTIDLVERHFIEAALELTQDNRTAAADVLGLSRQSLYLKLRRHRLLPGEGADADSNG